VHLPPLLEVVAREREGGLCRRVAGALLADPACWIRLPSAIAASLPDIERVTIITDEKTISSKVNGSMEARYFPMKPKPSTLAPNADTPTVPTPIEQQIQQRAYELYE
jgi:hypothetical protein